MIITLGIGDYAISNRVADVIRTHALGSCVALVIYHPAEQILAMAHVALPDSTIDRQMAKERPAYYADTAVAIITRVFESEFSCRKPDLHVRLYGGAYGARKFDLFNIGMRNLRAIEDACIIHGLSCRRVETGGLWSRTVNAEVVTGIVETHAYPLKY